MGEGSGAEATFFLRALRRAWGASEQAAWAVSLLRQELKPTVLLLLFRKKAQHAAILKTGGTPDVEIRAFRRGAAKKDNSI